MDPKFSIMQSKNYNINNLSLSINLTLILILFLFSDGSTQQLSGCLRDFRNKPFATRAKIEYYMNTLTVCI